MTNYDAVIYEVIEHLKNEKSIPPEYRNALISDGRRWQMQIRGALTLTKIKPENRPSGNGTSILSSAGYDTAQTASIAATDPQNAVCSCPAGDMRRDCPVHGRLS